MSAAVKQAKVEVFYRVDGLWDWRVVAGNGRVVATSHGQGFTTERDAHRGWKSALRAFNRARVVA